MVLFETSLAAWGETMALIIITEITWNKISRQNYTERTQKRIRALCMALQVHLACFLSHLESFFSWKTRKSSVCREPTRSKNMGVERQNDGGQSLPSKLSQDSQDKVWWRRHIGNLWSMLYENFEPGLNFSSESIFIFNLNFKVEVEDRSLENLRPRNHIYTSRT